MILGIVGSEGAKFTPEREAKAKELILELIRSKNATGVCSGECHLGGVDIWARDIALRLKLDYIGCPPKNLTWSTGFKPRNEEIARKSDEVVSITVAELPPGFKEGGWERYCYHCKSAEHIKSGGCWTTKAARRMGKPGYTLVIK